MAALHNKFYEQNPPGYYTNQSEVQVVGSFSNIQVNFFLTNDQGIVLILVGKVSLKFIFEYDT